MVRTTPTSNIATLDGLKLDDLRWEKTTRAITSVSTSASSTTGSR